MEKNVRATERHGKILGHLEQEILETLWAKGGGSGREIHADIKRTRDIALTTVLTVLERLSKKGLVRKIKGESVYLFRPACTKEEFAKNVSHDVLKGIFDISTSGATASFVEMLGDADLPELERLSAIIEKKKKELGGKQG